MMNDKPVVLVVDDLPQNATPFFVSTWGEVHFVKLFKKTAERAEPYCFTD